ncbi:MAG TPA: multicopper oxidase family protein [Candidatus Sulfotelmatobacter sp.]|nr:multicopper oxidase family protein [Candidatus Sulfotelmatobacter sp.]
MKKAISMTRLLLAAMAAVTMLFSVAANAAAPGISGTTFNLTAQPAYLTQPDGQMVYSWGYGCATGFAPTFAPKLNVTGTCGTMQVPGPTLIVTEGQPITVTLTNNLPNAAGNTSILFPGITLQPFTDGVAGLLTQEAAPGQTVTYKFTAPSPGTRSYYSGTQGDLQVEMGLYGAIIVLPAQAISCPAHSTYAGVDATGLHLTSGGEGDFRLANAAYDSPKSCYDREYLFQFSEIDPNIHTQAEKQTIALSTCAAGAPGCSLNVPTEPYHPAYFMINGRSMPDDMDPNYASQYPHQPYNGDPHMHPGEQVLLRIIGQGRWQHPFHEHGNHVRVLGRDGNLILSQTDGTELAGPLLFTTTTTPGQAMDGIFYWTARGLNWDAYGHNPASPDAVAKLTCTPDANGYNTGDPSAINYYEWCQDHNKPLQVAPFGDLPGGGPATLPDPNLFTNGAWFSGSPYLGPDATARATFGTPCSQAAGGCVNGANGGTSGTTPPSGTIANNPSTEAGFAFMWHSHNEREITTNNIFPGGMLMMMLVDSREFPIDETN